MALLQELAHRLLRHPVATTLRRRNKVLAVLAGTGQAPVAELARALVDELGRSRRVISLGPDDRSRFPNEASLCEWLDQVEREYEWIVLAGASHDLEWANRILGVADQVLIAVGGRHAPYLDPRLIERVNSIALRRRELVIVHDAETSQPAGTAAWLDVAPVNFHHHVRRGHGSDVARLSNTLRSTSWSRSSARESEPRHGPVRLASGRRVRASAAPAASPALAVLSAGPGL